MESRPLSVLLIDDDAEARLAMALCLRSAGYEVTSASGGREGLRLLQENTFNVLVTDLLMPETDGIEVLVALRQRAVRPAIIAVSGGGGHLDAASVLKLAAPLGAHVTLAKPFSTQDLLAAVRRALDAARQSPLAARD